MLDNMLGSKRHKYQNAHFRFCVGWSRPASSRLRWSG